jgi:hypothetical protein
LNLLACCRKVSLFFFFSLHMWQQATSSKVTPYHALRPRTPLGNFITEIFWQQNRRTRGPKIQGAFTHPSDTYKTH